MNVVSLTEAIAAHGMTPPRDLVTGRWLRFPGIGKGRSNRSGWCKVITPTLAVFGDWSSGLTEVWRDDAHTDSEQSRRLLQEAREQAKRSTIQQEDKQREVAKKAQQLVRDAIFSGHPYLQRKGFASLTGLVSRGKLIVPVRDELNYSDIISAQWIDADGEKRFLAGGRTKHGIYRLGVDPGKARRVVLCEGYATGLSLDAALQRLPGPHTVIVCFSANNLELVAHRYKLHDALIAADNDESRTGEECAKRTGLPWVMPNEVGADWNDVHVKRGLYSVIEALRMT